MNYEAYSGVEPNVDTDLWRDFEALADHWSGKCARLLNAIDSFLKNKVTSGYRVAPVPRGWRDKTDRNDGVEVYLVPFVVDEAAALLRVDHKARDVTFVALYESFGGYLYAAQWNQIIDLASDAAQ